MLSANSKLEDTVSARVTRGGLIHAVRSLSTLGIGTKTVMVSWQYGDCEAVRDVYTGTERDAWFTARGFHDSECPRGKGSNDRPMRADPVPDGINSHSKQSLKQFEMFCLLNSNLMLAT
jgi:hypothetical protein